MKKSRVRENDKKSVVASVNETIATIPGKDKGYGRMQNIQAAYALKQVVE